MLKYPSLENNYNITSSRRLMAAIDEKFYATEKIHGSNMSIEFTENSTRYFSRNREVTLDDKALGSYLATTNNLKDIESIAKSILEGSVSLSRKENNITKVIVFGELYGSGIQNMEYAENKAGIQEFRVFDVFVFEDDRAYTLNAEELLYIFGQLAVPFFTEVKSLREWLTTELPETSTLGGPIEGLVYKPFDGQILYFDDGAVCNYLGVKHKTEKFAEIKSRKKEAPVLTDDEISFKENIKRYFTMQRLDNLLSKGDVELSVRNLGTIIPAYLEDVKTDYIKDNPDSYFNQRILNKAMSSLVVKLVEEKLAQE